DGPNGSIRRRARWALHSNPTPTEPTGLLPLASHALALAVGLLDQVQRVRTEDRTGPAHGRIVARNVDRACVRTVVAAGGCCRIRRVGGIGRCCVGYPVVGHTRPAVRGGDAAEAVGTEDGADTAGDSC